MLSVVIPTKNEAANIAACVLSFGDAVRRGEAEVVVVDNSSPDRTRAIAAEHGARVFEAGPERCAQRNRGWREARGGWVLFSDADMVFPPETVAEILSVCASPGAADAYYVPEVRAGRGFRARARNFERGFYNGTCIDGVRLVRREFLERTGGYDENLVACEDWDLDRRLAAAGARMASLRGHLVHNEANMPLGRFLAKKAYYSASVGRYRAKWGDDAVMKRQFGILYRYLLVFVENGRWRRVLRHPLLFAGMMAERLAVGAGYLACRARPKDGDAIAGNMV